MPPANNSPVRAPQNVVDGKRCFKEERYHGSCNLKCQPGTDCVGEKINTANPCRPNEPWYGAQPKGRHRCAMRKSWRSGPWC